VPLRQRFDRLLLGAAVAQTAVGLVVLASASWLVATERYHRPGTFFVAWQAAVAVIGLGLLVAAMHLRLDLLDNRRLVWAGLGGTWFLLLLVFLQPTVANTHRWLSVGGISVQPSVLARLVVVLVAAAELPRAAAEGWSLRRLAPLATMGAVTCGLIVVEPDLGSAVLVVLVLGAMAFVAGMPMRLLALPGAAAAVAVVGAVLTSPYRLERLRAFLDPAAGSAAGWQTYQSLVALGSGGLLGRGYGAGLQKLFFLPEPHTDFIFSIAGEELGLVGILVLVLLPAVVVWRGLAIAARQTASQRGLLAFGLTFAFAAQTLIHMIVCLGLVPPKGIPLPLVSYGKIDLLATMAAVGLLLNLSRGVTR